MTFLSKRINKIQPSGIRKVFELAAQGGNNYINLSIGQPDFEVPIALKEEIKRAVSHNLNSYTPTLGLFNLRKTIANKLCKENSIQAEVEEVIVTSGVSGALFLLFNSVLDPGDEIIVPEPYFVLYKQVLDLLDVKMVPLDTYPSFHLDGGELEKLITTRTKAIILNSPNNPTGAVYGQGELEKVAEVASRHGLLVISDEIYEKYDYDKQFFSIGSIYKNTVTLNGFSKSHAITGWRLGYAHGPREIIEAMNTLQQYTFVCAPSMVQAAMLEYSDKKNSIDINLKYKNKRDYLFDNLKDLYELNKPEGAFYSFIKIPDKRENFIDELIKHNLLIVPGNVFSKRNDYFRVSFAVNDEILKKGVEILRKLR